MIKEMILDTDLGADCDDAVAIALMCKAINDGLIYSDTLSISSSRKYAPSAARALLKEYLNYEFTIGKMVKPLKCDEFDYYNKDIYDAFPQSNNCFPSLFVLENKLNSIDGEVSLVCIGPLSNIAELLRKEPVLFDKKIKDIYAMCCTFDKNEPEWNIAQDIKSARYVFNHCRKPLYVCPSELGNKIQTGETLANKENSPTKMAIESFKKNSECPDKSLSRESWDSLTVLACLDKSYFQFSKKGKCTIDKNGVSAFKETNRSNVIVVSFKSDASMIKAKEFINKSII